MMMHALHSRILSSSGVFQSCRWSVLVSVLCESGFCFFLFYGVLFFSVPPIVCLELWGEEPTHFHVTKALECTNHRALITHSTMVVLFELFHVIIPLQQVGLA